MLKCQTKGHYKENWFPYNITESSRGNVSPLIKAKKKRVQSGKIGGSGVVILPETCSRCTDELAYHQFPWERREGMLSGGI